VQLLLTTVSNGHFCSPALAFALLFAHKLSILDYPTFSTPAHWCRIFQSRIFRPCISDRPSFSGLVLSVAPVLTQPLAWNRRHWQPSVSVWHIVYGKPSGFQKRHS